jgi:formamidopyrimidine-DNA glycosylase
MPELPEVEIARRGIAPHLVGKRICRVVSRTEKLRLPIPPGLDSRLSGQFILALERRGKYLLVRCSAGTLILHLGMSGNLRLVTAALPAGKNDRLDLVLDSGLSLRFIDPRRFGTVVWTEDDPLSHPLLAAHGPEPLGDDFSGDYLYGKSRGRTRAIKQLIMDSQILAGVGNIYANEALFRAAILPGTAAGKLSATQCQRLADAIKEVLTDAIACGGSTLDDFLGYEGKPGYFPMKFAVYGRSGSPCPICSAPIQQSRLGGRSTYFCSNCQR